MAWNVMLLIFFSLQCFINAVQFNSAFNLVCNSECEASHRVSDGSLSGKKSQPPISTWKRARSAVRFPAKAPGWWQPSGVVPGRSCTAP